jgi:DNA-binding MarR family transcriptional regulator
MDISNLKSSSNSPYYPTHIPTDNYQKPSIPVIPSHNPTVPVEIEGLKSSNLGISSGNRGVPTDRQTNQQTDISDDDSSYQPSFNTRKPLTQQIKEASDILDSLDTLKKQIRLKFKGITQQEMLVFSTIYQLEEQFPEGVEYRQIATKLQLSESSIRDYLQKLLNKGIPVDKIKLNNKKILLKISSKLKNIATLDTLVKLREL